MGMRKQQRFRRGTTILAITAALATATACQPAVVVGNVKIRQTPNAVRVWDNSDPAVLVAGGKNYLYGSTNNMKVPVREVPSFHGTVAQSRTDWAANPQDAMRVRPSWVNPSKHGSTWQIWAPSVMKIGSRYVMYFGANRAGATKDPSNDQCIGRATSNSPLGPFTPTASPVYCGLKAEPGSNPWGRGALDPEVFEAPDGKLYLLVALTNTKDNIGVLRLNSSGAVFGGVNATPRIVVGQSLKYHDGTDNGSLGSGAFLENPTMHYDKATKTYLLFYSAGQWYTSRYLTGFARCATPLGPCVVDNRGSFLRGAGSRSGPGGMTVFTDAGGTLRVGYATWRAGQENQPSPSNDPGSYSRQTHWARLLVSNTSDQKAQTIKLG